MNTEVFMAGLPGTPGAFKARIAQIKMAAMPRIGLRFRPYLQRGLSGRMRWRVGGEISVDDRWQAGGREAFVDG
jgi:hypothetical protein